MTGSTFDFDAIRAAHPIDSIIGQAVKLTKAGREYKGLCPFHDERTPSFHVIPDKGFYHCFGCGAHGDVIDFVATYQNIDIAEAAIKLAGDAALGEQTDEAKAARAAIKEQREREEAERKAAATAKARAKWEAAAPADPNHPYLVRKGVGPHTCRQSGVILILPIRDSDGEIISIQTIADDGGKRFQAGAPVAGGRFYLGINMGRTIICEGFATGASIYDAIPDQVAIAFSLDNMGKVARQLHAEGRSIVLASDTGNAAKAMRALGAELGVPVIVPRSDIPGDTPDKAGSDFNDQARAFGVDDVARTFREGLRDFAEAQQAKAERLKEATGPVDLWAAPEVPKLPRGLLPPIIERFAVENSAQIGADEAGFAMAALAACASVISDSIQLKPKVHEKWTQPARIWVMLIGKPSTRKSTMIRHAVGAIKRLDSQMLYANNKALAEWQEAGGSKSGDPRPATPRLRIEDTTTEAAQEIMQHSPDGVLVLQDEMKGFFGRIEKYGGKNGGADKAFWLQTYEGGQYAVNRVGRGSYIIDNLSATILGGIQPGPLGEILAVADDDGLIQRFIPVLLREASMERDVPMPPVTEELESLIERLHRLKPPSNFFGVQPVTLSDDARKVREELLAEHFDMVRYLEDYNSKLASHIAKAEGLFVRLCLTWHCVAYACADDAGEGLPAEVTADTARKVAAFMRGFIRGHSMSFYIGSLGISLYDDVMKDVASWLLAQEIEGFVEGDISRNVRAYRALEPMQREAVMGSLEAFGWVEKTEPKRRDAKAWRVLPEVQEKFAAKAESERIRRENVRNVISEAIQEKRALD